MSNKFQHPGATNAWLHALKHVMLAGLSAAPRGMPTKELLHRHAVTVDMNYPAINVPERGLSKRFMATEALWILSGDNRVQPLSDIVPRMAEFSDDGVTLAGAYGPRIVAQQHYALQTLLKDPDTRQAVIGIWERNPAPSKDIPCTLALVFSIREQQLHCHALMRSSDVWLGLPYDIFSFSMVATKLACLLNTELPIERRVELGSLTITATSSHLYERDLKGVNKVMEWLDDLEDRVGYGTTPPEGFRVPSDAVLTGRWSDIEKSLQAAADGWANRFWPILPTTDKVDR